MGSGAKNVRVNYYEGNFPRFIKGKFLSEDDDFLKIELNNYILRIAKKHIIKIEEVKVGGDTNSSEK